MKNLFLIAVIVLGFSAASFGQSPVTATSSASAILITPLTIENTANMSFGTVAATSNAGTIVLNDADVLEATAGARIIGSSPGVTAKFTILGEKNQAISITTIANDAIVILKSGDDELEVTDWTPNYTGQQEIGDLGKLDITVGATLRIPALAPSGTYVNNAAYEVTVNYN